MLIRRATRADIEAFSHFIGNAEPFCCNEKDIISEFEKDQTITFLLFNSSQEIKGFIQGCGSEVLYIGVSPELRRPFDPKVCIPSFSTCSEVQQIGNPTRRRYGSELYEFYRNECGDGLPGFYAYVEAEDLGANSFWKAMGFTKSENYYWFKPFELYNNVNIKLPKSTVRVEICNNINKLIPSFKTDGYFEEEKIVLKQSFVGFKNSVNDVLKIYVDDECVHSNKLKYSTEYGYSMDSRWVIFSEIKLNSVETEE